MITDAQLKSDVTTALECDPTLHASEILVTTKDGVVTLAGTVPHFAEKQAAEHATQRVRGVRAIAEDLKVQVAGTHQRSDSEIAQSIVDSLKWNVWIPKKVQVVVENGWVTLSGDVTWNFQRKSAEDAIRYQSGVKGVSNQITLTPSAKATEVKSVIEKALKRNAVIDAAQISVSADGGKVKLAGSVRSWDERQQACSAAWSTPGVIGVENDLLVNA